MISCRRQAEVTRRRAIALYVVGLLAFVDCGARLTLRLLARWKHVEYRPSTLTLGEADRAQVAAIAAGDPRGGLDFDAELGWVNRAGDGVNAQGVRSRRVYAPEPPPGVTRLAAFG